MKTIFRYLKPFIPRMGLGLTIKFTGSAVELLLPWILSYMIDEMAPTKDMGQIAWWGAAMVLAAVTAWAANILANRMAAWVAQHTKAGMTMALTNPLMNLFLNIGLTAVIIVGAFRVNAGLPVTPAPREASPYHVQFDHVTFSYAKKEANVENISFALKPGETLGIIGATGCGKSTLIHLLMRLYDAALRTALREEYAGVTTVIIAQRVSSILHADHILVLDEGRELGYGTHEELMESCQVYREIAVSQMGSGMQEGRES